jgi:hypothetical protein
MRATLCSKSKETADRVPPVRDAMSAPVGLPVDAPGHKGGTGDEDAVGGRG